MTLVQRLSMRAVCGAALLAGSVTGMAQNSLHVWESGTTPATLETWVNARLATVKADIDELTAIKGDHTIANTLRLYDDAQNELALAGNEAYLMYSVGDSAPLRDKGQELVSKVSSAATDLSLNQAVYRALAAIPAPANDPAAKHYLEHTLLEYRLAGVDKDDATRAKIRQLQDKITEASLVFGRNVADGRLDVKATKSELKGLPEDYIARHKPAADGTYTLTTDSPDSTPVLNFAADAGLRRRMYLAYNERAYPKNVAVLKSVLEARQELATTLGYKTFADLAMADQMMGSASNLRKFLQDVDDASREAADKEFNLLQAYAKQQEPGLTGIPSSDANYWSEQYRRAKYDFDAQSVRPYFPYAEVQAGILKTAAALFHVEFRAVPNAKTWDPSVSTYDVFDNTASKKKLGRIYLDMHPRDGKDKWFSSAPVVPGIRGRQLPEGALICNFSGGVPGDPGLMEYSEVVTFFHEFGHLMHHILGGQGEWSNAGGFNVEGDFVEAPSQMLEEMFRDRGILQSFAKHYKTGETIPTALIDKMDAAGAYGRGRWMQSQLFYSTYSLQVHDRAPEQVNFDALLREDSERFSHFSFVDGNRMYASFTHLTGYSSNYYTYVLDKVIAVDFFSQFDKSNLLGGPTAMRYRRTVLEPGATKPAAELVKDFLGRPQNLTALKQWINEEFAAKTNIGVSKGQ
ncbi:M3 family metallopeptidase [Edaphobacter albus]|uniref:M3 family metallopeptidase n=1 Tax=Edaphobacter sp. 4G125 TaxID=2763071 RepID=UPI001644B02C|nr:M3 family metallopeptidase [Edaphobacter sp. 4G125]QNI37123.1 Zn-dependent oligopeptidase [Edaphobacter sp. 4G125]